MVNGVSKRRFAGTFGCLLIGLMVALLSLRNQKETTGVLQPKNTRLLSPWKPGLLDIHHLQVGSSVSTFIVNPDGTTILVDAGDVNVPHTLSKWSKQGPPLNELKLKDPYPNDSKTPVEWIIDYMRDFWPVVGATKDDNKLELDYLLLTHFHSDHVGDGSDDMTNRSKSTSGKYVLSGIPELVSKINVKTIIDRGFPDYNVPVDLRSLHDKSIDNYLQFVQENKESIHFEQFQVGSSDQIRLLKNKSDQFDFRIRVIKSSLQVEAPLDAQTFKGGDRRGDVQEIPGSEALTENLHSSENTMSAAIVMEYGKFRYYEGADQEVIRNSNGDVIFDTIGPTAKAAGKVDVATLNHHGHGVSHDYITYIDPPFTILQGWSSDQPPKKSVEMLAAHPPEGNPRKIFATDIHQERLDDLGPVLSELFQSKSGHVVVRVQPPEKETDLPDAPQTFEIVTLDGDRRIKAHHGRFPVRMS